MLDFDTTNCLGTFPLHTEPDLALAVRSAAPKLIRSLVEGMLELIPARKRTFELRLGFAG